MSDITVAIKDLAQRCLEREQVVVTAESCTGGGIGYYFTSLPGSSAWFDRGYITYSNQAKIECLDVKSELIDKHGAVSEAVAKAMAEGALKHSAGTISVAVTGVAGPDGGSASKPVGTVWIAWAVQAQAPLAEQFLFTGNREEVRLQTISAAVAGLTRLMP